MSDDEIDQLTTSEVWEGLRLVALRAFLDACIEAAKVAREDAMGRFGEYAYGQGVADGQIGVCEKVLQILDDV